MNEVLLYGVLILCDKYRLLAQATALTRIVIAEENGPLFVRLCTTYACVLARDASSICSRNLSAVTLALVGLNTISFSFDTFYTLPTFQKTVCLPF